jgi:hypothetical protein
VRKRLPPATGRLGRKTPDPVEANRSVTCDKNTFTFIIHNRVINSKSIIGCSYRPLLIVGDESQ